MKHQAVIASYAKDFPWLIHCLASLRKLATGYLPPVVSVDQSDYDGARRIVEHAYPEATVSILNGRPGQGFMRAQIAMMSGDLLCPQADIIHFIGSDCLALKPFDASIYADAAGKPYVLYTPYALAGPGIFWKAGTERVLNVPDIAYEFMRRLPSVLPAAIFAPMREHVAKAHQRTFEDYIHWGNIPRRDTSEANILGAYAWHFMRDTCHWVDTTTADLSQYPTGLGQFWSHGGLDLVMNATMNNFWYDVGGTMRFTLGKTPRAVINELLYGIGDKVR